MSDKELLALDAHWRAANYLTVGQIYLMANPLLDEPLRPEHIKPRLLGHWGTSPGLNLVHTHLNRVIKNHGHGLPSASGDPATAGRPSSPTPGWRAAIRRRTRTSAVTRRAWRCCSASSPSRAECPAMSRRETPGSIHEGGELGYSLSHAYGAALDNPELLVACVIGDGEAETGPLAASWHSNKFLDPVHDGAVLPILHLNGYKIANPSILARLPVGELDDLLRGLGHDPLHVEGDDPLHVHGAMAHAMDTALDRIGAIQHGARHEGVTERRRWPLIVLRTPKGWTGPAEVDGLPVEGTWRAHQVPLAAVRENPDHRRQLEQWLRSYRPVELFDDQGRPRAQVLECVPDGAHRLGASAHTNGGLLVRDLPLPSLEGYAVPVDKRGTTLHEPTRVLGGLLETVMARTAGRRDFRLFGPDETASNRLQAVYRATGKAWQERRWRWTRTWTGTAA